MTTPARVPGLYGRRPPKRHPAIAIGPRLNPAAPVFPVAADYLTVLRGGWKMLGNGPDPDNAAAGVPPGGAGDCVAVWWANQRRLITAALGPHEVYPSLGLVVEVYKTQNPGFPNQDDGMDIQTLLEYLVSHGGPDGVKALGFGSVDHTNPDEVRAAIATGGSLCIGINVQDVNENDFSDHLPWNYHSQGNVVGGHCVLTGGYGPPGAAALGGDERFITWAQETSFTDSFWAHELEECWLVIWPEHLGSAQFLAGLDLAGFAADYQAITGKPFPVQVPPLPVPPAPPVPVPPPPVPVAADGLDEALWQAVEHWAVDERHTGDNKRAAMAAQVWAHGKGLYGV